MQIGVKQEQDVFIQKIIIWTMSHFGLGKQVPYYFCAPLTRNSKFREFFDVLIQRHFVHSVIVCLASAE